MEKGNYDLVLEVVEFYDDEEIMDDFKNEFEEGKNISKKSFVEFFNRFIDDMSEVEFIKKNWKYVKSGGDWSILEDDEWGQAIRPTQPHYIYLLYKLTKTNTHDKETRNTNVYYGSNDLRIRFNSICFNSFIGLHNSITYI